MTYNSRKIYWNTTQIYKFYNFKTPPPNFNVKLTLIWEKKPFKTNIEFRTRGEVGLEKTLMKFLGLFHLFCPGSLGMLTGKAQTNNILNLCLIFLVSHPWYTYKIYTYKKVYFYYAS